MSQSDRKMNTSVGLLLLRLLLALLLYCCLGKVLFCLDRPWQQGAVLIALPVSALWTAEAGGLTMLSLMALLR